MSPKARKEYVTDMRVRYAAAGPAARSALLDEVVAMTGYHRKYAIALLHGRGRVPTQRRRRRTYDLVAHCGESSGGEFIYSLNATDIATGWTETRAILGKGQRAVITALRSISDSLPFTLLGIDSDSGSEFINAQLLRWCREREIQFTRSRPYRKNDNAHIEQKNWTHVRKLFGWLRFDSIDARDGMNALYENEIRTWMNYFQPSVKLVRKERIGSRVRKYYDAPQTPFDRLAATVHRIQDPRSSVDPFVLTERITTGIAELCGRANRELVPSRRRYGPNPSTAPPSTEYERYLGKKLRGATVHR